MTRHLFTVRLKGRQPLDPVMHESAAWVWVQRELGYDEPLHIDAVIAVCERELRRPRDQIHRDWAEVVMKGIVE